MLLSATLAQPAVEVGSSTFVSEWGTLLGVALGAILAGLSQVLAGAVQRRHELESDRRLVKREAYTEFLRALDDYQIAIVVLDGRGKSPRVKDAEDYAAKMHAFNSAFSVLQIQGSKAVCDIAEKIRAETNQYNLGDGGRERSDAFRAITRLEKDLVSEIRRDLGVTDRA